MTGSNGPSWIWSEWARVATPQVSVSLQDA